MGEYHHRTSRLIRGVVVLMSEEIINLKPIGSMLTISTLTKTVYHVTKFYSRVKRYEKGWIHMGYEAIDKHKSGECKFCAIEEK